MLEIGWKALRTLRLTSLAKISQMWPKGCKKMAKIGKQIAKRAFFGLEEVEQGWNTRGGIQQTR